MLLVLLFFFFFFNDTATTEIYTLSLHDALPISTSGWQAWSRTRRPLRDGFHNLAVTQRLRRAACGKSTSPWGPGPPAPAGRAFAPTPACERSPLALDALVIARCVPAWPQAPNNSSTH